MWDCACDCGKGSTIASTGHLRSGHTTSCGCKRKGKCTKDISGMKFGFLSVLSIDDVKSGKNAYWLCRCDCGKEKIIPGIRLRSGQAKSCGCVREQKLAERKLPHGVASLNSIYSVYKTSAKKRNLKFEISKEEFIKLTQSECFYCGAKPSNAHGNIDNNGKYIYNGIDRVDNTDGYIHDNIVPCCKICNYAKNTMSLEEFIYWIAKAYSHTQELPIMKKLRKVA